jgi:hypothetical protein
MLSSAEALFAIKQFKELLKLGKIKLGKNKTEKQIADEYKAILMGKEPSDFTDELIEEGKKVLPFGHSDLRALKHASIANKTSKARKKVAAKKRPAAKKKVAAKKKTY